ncbi:MAG: hypothetical protein JST84_01670 [Acidobacteria bacterium]|nr:hypothetical protein [Acidobacteriota bacterium]
MSERNETPVPTENLPEAKMNSVADESLDKVRDILFGAQAREFERRFALLEEDLLRKTAEAREEARQRLETLEAYLRQEVQNLADRITEEQEERAKVIDGLSMDLHELTQQLDEKINLLDTQTSQEQGDLRQSLMEEAKALSDEIQQRSKELTTNLNREVKTLSQDKLNRADISQMFSEMSKRFLGK